ncbi:kinesin-like protein costa [Musca autumnalis]|uniref:kinesin-like protein costa n=1 Tax=Musca autumnalis TaxID=221902 RepID=UPI003CF19269
MEIPIQVAVRICPVFVVEDDNGNLRKDEEKDVTTTNDATNNDYEDDERDRKCCVRNIPFAPRRPPPPIGCMDPGVVQVGPHSFPVTHALPLNCTQNQVYHQAVFPLMSLFMEGFDASVVAYGQRGCGKTYALYGTGFNESPEKDDHGVVARCIREIFNHIANHPERTYAVNITWVEICREIIRDVFGVGSVQCMNVTDAFHWLKVGYKLLNSTKSQMGHSLFSITLEQRWISKEGLIQHRLSTASFTDLCATERLFMLNSLEQPTSLPKDLGLQSLERVVSTLIDPSLIFKANGNVPYNQTMLTTLLKDSFGGRAQTLVIVCVSPLERDINETICNMQFAFKVQCVRNFVVINSFSDDNTPVSPTDELPPEMRDVGMGLPPTQVHDNFGLQFAASQWSKLVANAEDLLSKLISSNTLGETDKQQIEEWLLQKQECEECLNSTDSMQAENALGPIQEEADEQDEEEEVDSDPDLSDTETPLQQNSENESDVESPRADLEEKLEILMEDLKTKTDDIVKQKYQEFMVNHPKGVMESQESIRIKKDNSYEEKQDERKPSLGSSDSNSGGVIVSPRGGSSGGCAVGRRRSIQPGSALSSAEIAMLNRVASRERSESDKSKENQQLEPQTDDFLDMSTDLTVLRPHVNSPLEAMQKKIRKLDADIEARQKQIKEIEETMQLKQNIVTELIKNSDTRTTAKQRFHKKRAKLEAEYEKSKKALNKAMAQQRDKSELDRLKSVINHLEQRLNDVTSIKHIAGESVQKVKKLQQSLQESKKLMEELQKKVKKEKKLREALQNELKSLKEKENTKALTKHEDTPKLPEEKTKHLKDVQSRIAHLDHVLKEKSDNLEQYRDDEQREGLRHEIRNLRRTRDHLLDQRCSLDRKLKRDKMLSHKEERKLLECDEAIEAIDAAIEFKNELICGHKSIDTSERLQREKGEQMLMARLNKLSNEEMRTLLYKYFTKVIDLRDSSRKLEIQLVQLEREKDAWEWKERVLSNAVRQARLEGERNAVLLQRQHEMKLTLMLRHLAEETSNSSASFSDQSLSVPRFYKPSHLALPTPTTLANAVYTDSDYEWLSHHGPPAPPQLHQPSNNNNTNARLVKASKINEMEMCPITDPTLTKYKPLDKIKDKERETKNKLFAKFQVLTRYATNTPQHNDDSNIPSTSSSNSTTGNKRKDKEMNKFELTHPTPPAIPQENLKKLSGNAQNTKVTRQKNKIIIQDKSRKN